MTLERAIDLLESVQSGDESGLDELHGGYIELNHESRCAYRHMGPCTCIKMEIAIELELHGREVG